VRKNCWRQNRFEAEKKSQGKGEERDEAEDLASSGIQSGRNIAEPENQWVKGK